VFSWGTSLGGELLNNACAFFRLVSVQCLALVKCVRCDSFTVKLVSLNFDSVGASESCAREPTVCVEAVRVMGRRENSSHRPGLSA
jgi:hypothetical protein